MQKKLLLIVNPKAGKTQSRGPLFDAAALLSESGYSLRIHTTTGRGDATQMAASCGESYDVVVCSGGDGTLNETISGLMQLENPPALGYLPRGSTNDFATSLHISSDPVTAAAAIARGNSRKLDIGCWNDRYFAYVASFGAFTRSSYSAPQTAKNAVGHLAYILEGMRDLDTLRPYRVKITADGEVLDGEYLFGAICNSTSLGGLMKLSEDEVIVDDGLFEMLLIPKPRSPLNLPNLIQALLSQDYTKEGMIFRHVSSLTVVPEDDLPWSLDGEYAASEERVEILNRRAALTFLL